MKAYIKHKNDLKGNPDELFVFIAVEKDGKSGVMTMQNDNGDAMPLLMANIKLADKLIPYLAIAAAKEDITIQLRKYTSSEILRTI